MHSNKIEHAPKPNPISTFAVTSITVTSPSSHGFAGLQVPYACVFDAGAFLLQPRIQVLCFTFKPSLTAGVLATANPTISGYGMHWQLENAAP